MLKCEQLLNNTENNVLIKSSRFITIVNNYCKSQDTTSYSKYLY